MQIVGALFLRIEVVPRTTVAADDNSMGITALHTVTVG